MNAWRGARLFLGYNKVDGRELTISHDCTQRTTLHHYRAHALLERRKDLSAIPVSSSLESEVVDGFQHLLSFSCDISIALLDLVFVCSKY